MRLIKLTSNKEQFKDVYFKNKVGINIINAVRYNEYNNDVDDSKYTYNGLGKSLIINLIDFCLGSKKIKEFEKKLNDWSFILYFSINDIEYKIERYCNNQDIILFNEKEYKYDKIHSILSDKLFYEKLPNSISFRSIISRFLRTPTKEGYSNIFKPNTTKETDYLSLLNTSYLLGIETRFIEDKYNLKKFKKDETNKLVNLEKYEHDNIKEYIDNIDNLNKSKIKIEKKDLENKIAELESKLEDYEVAENYNSIKIDADNFTIELRKIENEITICTNILKQIEDSLNIKFDVSLKELEMLFNEVQFIFPDKVKKQIKDVGIFHKKIISERINRLENEKASYNKKRNELCEKRKLIAVKRDNCMKYLGTHKALEEYEAMQKKLLELINIKDNLDKYLNIISEKESINERYKEKSIELDKETKQYIDENKISDHLTSEFRKLSSRFYEDKAGGIIVELNNGNNQLRFNIDITIDDDASAGIYQVKLFCFDILLSILRKHNIGFIFHDSQLFSDMDPRQRLTALKTINDIAEKYNIQYICNFNNDLLNFSNKDISNEEKQKLIIDNIVLELTDQDDSHKLLGEKISINLGK